VRPCVVSSSSKRLAKGAHARALRRKTYWSARALCSHCRCVAFSAARHLYVLTISDCLQNRIMDVADATFNLQGARSLVVGCFYFSAPSTRFALTCRVLCCTDSCCEPKRGLRESLSRYDATPSSDTPWCTPLLNAHLNRYGSVWRVDRVVCGRSIGETSAGRARRDGRERFGGRWHIDVARYHITMPRACKCCS
jgi:hypothetical protein